MRSERKSVVSLVQAVLKTQPIEQASDPISQQFKDTRARFMEQQYAFKKLLHELPLDNRRNKAT